MESQTIDAIANRLESLGDVIPPLERLTKAHLIAEIAAWKRERRAVVLGHNYMEAALYHEVSDFTGDSLELCRRAAASDAEILVFCGVEFMAETAKIINPNRTVLIPSTRAGCSLASSITAADVRALRKAYPGVPVVSYINTYADVKAETDICCTSGNAAQVVESLDSDTVIFIPDEFLARNVAQETGKHIIFPDKNPTQAGSDTQLDKVFISWRGRCEVHEQFKPSDIENVRKQFPDVEVLAHPECPPEVVAASDYTGSTSKMMKHVENSQAERFLLLTECAMADNVIAAMPEKEVLRLCSVRCPHMAQISLEQTRDALKFKRYEVDLAKDVIEKARASIDRMLAI